MASKSKAKTTKVKAHKRKITEKKKPEIIEDPEAPLPDDPGDEIDDRSAALAEAHEQLVVARRRYARKLTISKVKAALQECSGIISQAAELLGTSRTSLYEFIKKDPAIKAFLLEVRDEMLDACESTILLAVAGGNVEIAKWYLTKMGAERGYSDRMQFQALDAGGKPVDFREKIINARPVLKPDAPVPANPVL